MSLAGRWVAYTSWEVAPGRRCISVATSASPAGPFVDNNPGPIVCDSDPGGSIDPQPFVDSNGQPYLLWKSTGVPGSAPTKIKSRALSGDGLSFAPGSSPVAILQTELPWDGNSIENPSMVKYAGTYWLIYSGNEWESANYRMGQAACAGPLGPCSRTSGSPLIPNTATEWSPGGGTLFTDTSGRLRIIYQVWNAPYTSYPTNPNCDGPGLCASQGQRFYRIDGVAATAGHLTVDPIGALDQATLSGNSINISGWGLDPSTTSSIQVHVYVDGAAVPLVANESRPDVGAAFPGLGSAHGFSAVVGAGPGTHQVCAFGIGVGTPGQQRARLPHGGRPRLRALREPRGGHAPAWARSRSRAGRSIPTRRRPSRSTSSSTARSPPSSPTTTAPTWGPRSRARAPLTASPPRSRRAAGPIRSAP